MASYATNWGTDKFTCGGYSSFGPGATPALHKELSKPEGHNLFFAGEHTAEDNMSTVEGAWRSGLRAAKEVIEEDEED